MKQLSLQFAQKFLNSLKSEEQGQDLVEYALLVGFMVIAIWAFFPTQIVPSMSEIFTRFISLAARVA